MPHALCLRTPQLLWLHAVSDGCIALAYFLELISFALLRLVQRRKDLPLSWMFILFAAFILSCGATHVLAIVTLWIPIYAFEGLIKSITALVSIATAVLMIGSMPQISAQPSIEQWRRSNEELKTQIQARSQAEEKNALLAAVVGASDDAIISKTLEGIITSWNPGAERLFGYSAGEAIGQHVGLIIPPERAVEEASLLARIFQGGAVQRLQTTRLHKNGRIVRVSLSASPMWDGSGRVVGAAI